MSPSTNLRMTSNGVRLRRFLTLDEKFSVRTDNVIHPSRWVKIRIQASASRLGLIEIARRISLKKAMNYSWAKIGNNMPLTLINQLQGKKQVKNLPSAVTNSQEFVVKFLSTETKHQKFVKMLPSRVVSRHQMFTKLQTVLVRLHKSIMNLPRDLLIRSVSLHITIENLQPPKLYIHSHIEKSNGKPQSKSLLNLVNKLNRTPLSTRIHIWIMKLISTSRPMWLLILGQKLNRYSRMFSSMS